ncbi:hypothetical protein H6P81_008702 [Aristolochia fimbriata]|uniref:Pentatricopeptide repeat-containing protein n=1 Tax=Aristolochia fimbriata TaxID=158543 RepID=A0AAV7EMB8_ARIFI|nr:hypothetical protein H6P81_008702 [Aristolochia fimbriata]
MRFPRQTIHFQQPSCRSCLLKPVCYKYFRLQRSRQAEKTDLIQTKTGRTNLGSQRQLSPVDSLSEQAETPTQKIAAKHLFDLEPDKPGNYVLLSNFYASTGKWELVQKLRRVMTEKGLRKERGCSSIVVNVEAKYRC